MRTLHSAFLTSLAAVVPLLGRAADSPAPQPDIPMREVLVLGSAGRGGRGGRDGRSAVHTDPVEARIVSGDWTAPVAGGAVVFPGGVEQTWKAATADTNGVLNRAESRNGYVYWPFTSAGGQIMLLEAAGHSFGYINGEIHAGDPYGYGYIHVPVLLRPGVNEFLFQCSREGLRARLKPAPGALIVDTADPTLPDIILGETEPVWGAAILLNATTNFMSVSLRANGRAASEQAVTIPPLAGRKAPFRLHPPSLKQTGEFRVELEATDTRTGQKAKAEFKLRVRRPEGTYKRTFISSIDDSVQYYGVNPALRNPAPALFLSLHGASVEGMGQADACSPKTWGNIISPTNRRPYGFDWEEWGRWDAFEVLDLAQARYHPDPSRIYLNGHSMGGHGTWHLGANFPDRFAAIGPSAGWISFTSYVPADVGRSAPTNEVQRLLRRSAGDETLPLATNFLQEGVYILHGDADDNVPVTQARQMRKVLGEFHRDFDFFEQPGAGHWWDASDEPGTDCVDWAPMFDFFARHVIPTDESLRRIRFTTLNPAVSARSHWVSILAQEHELEPSSIDVRCDPGQRRFVGTTTNITRVLFELASIKPGAPVSVDLDGQKLEKIAWDKLEIRTVSNAAGTKQVPAVSVARKDGRWELAGPLAPAMKNPMRSGPFRQAFYNHVVLVYGTTGTPAENAWMLARARYDAEGFWYRGNGSLGLMSDTEFLGKQGRNGKLPNGKTRNVILYGHADCNAAWPSLLGNSPVQIHRGSVKVGNRELSGADLGCLFLQPNPHDDLALVGVVSGSGLPGLRMTERLPYFMAGAGFPDCLVVGPEMLSKGVTGVRAAGFFGQDWQVATGEFAWNE